MSAAPAYDPQSPLAERLGFLGLDRQARARIAKLSPMVLGHLEPALTRFYDKLARTPEVARFFSSPEHMNAAKAKQGRHWSALARGELDESYFAGSLAIGERHARIGLEPQWYIGGYGLIVEAVIEGVLVDWISAEARAMRKRKPEDTIAAGAEMAASLGDLIKAIMLDVDLAVSTYFDRLAGELEAERARAEALATDQQEVLDATGRALGDLAEGRLDTRIEREFPGGFAQLRADFNMAAERLDKAFVDIEHSVDAIGGGARSVADSASDLAERMTRQAAAIEQSAAALDEVTTNVNETAAGTGEASRTAAGANDAAEAGGKVVEDTVQAMQRIEQSSTKISSIISVIDEIAFQTNLLALNAAVEAARAGEAGRGFAVVATEVRSLAQRSAQAAKDVANLIKQSRGEVETGVGMVQKTGDALDGIVEQVGRISAHMRNFSAASGQQANTLNEINEAIVQLDRLTRENAGFVGQASEAGRDLAAEVSELHQRLARFRTSA